MSSVHEVELAKRDLVAGDVVSPDFYAAVDVVR